MDRATLVYGTNISDAHAHARSASLRGCQQLRCEKEGGISVSVKPSIAANGIPA